MKFLFIICKNLPMILASLDQAFHACVVFPLCRWPFLCRVENGTYGTTHSVKKRNNRKHKRDVFYYIDRSVLLENTPRVKFIRNYIRDPSGVFSISSPVRILMTSFPALSQSFVQTVGEKWRAIDLSI